MVREVIFLSTWVRLFYNICVLLTIYVVYVREFCCILCRVRRIAILAIIFK